MVEEKKLDNMEDVSDWPEPAQTPSGAGPEAGSVPPSNGGPTSPDEKTTIREKDEVEEVEKKNIAGMFQGAKPPYLVIVDGPRSGFRFPLDKGDNLIGRALNTAITLDDKSVSRRHVTVTQTAEQGWSIRDEGSKNGTYVNGKRITEPVMAGHRDTVQVGIYVLRLITRDVSEEEEMAPPPKVEFVPSSQPEAKDASDSAEATGSRKLAMNEAGELAPKEEKSLAEVAPKDLVAKGPSEEKAKPRYKLLLGIVFGLVILISLFFYWKYVLRAPGVVEPANVPPPVAGDVKEAVPAPEVPPAPVTVPVFLDFASSPLPAKVSFLNKEVGMTPVRVNVELEVGQSYVAEATFFMPELREQMTERVSFTVTQDQSVIPIFFKGSVGIIKVNNLPRDVQFYLEGYFDYDKFRAKPAKLAEIVFFKPIYVPYGKYVVELRRAKELATSGEYIQDICYRREIVIAEDNPSYILEVNEEDLKFFPAEIHSEPNNADVYVDQQNMGKTPYKGTFPIGEHTLTLKKDGYFDHTQKLAMDINTLLRADIAMKTSQAGEYINAGHAEMLKGLYQRAIDMFVEVFKYEPTEREQAQTNYLIGTSYLNLENYDGALGYFQKSMLHEDFKYASMLGLVAVYNKQNDLGKALPLLVEVMLKSKDEQALKDAHALFQKVSPMRSVMYVYTEPPGAIVFINDKPVEQATPVILHDLSLGNYKVVIKKDGYQSQQLNLNFSISEFNPILVKLKPIEQ